MYLQVIVIATPALMAMSAPAPSPAARCSGETMAAVPTIMPSVVRMASTAAPMAHSVTRSRGDAR